MSVEKNVTVGCPTSGDGADGPLWGPVSFVLRADPEPLIIDESNSLTEEVGAGHLLIEIETDELRTCRFEKCPTLTREA